MDPGHPNMMGRRGDGTISINMELAALYVFLRLLAPAQKATWLVPQVAWDNIYQKKVTKRLRTLFGSSKEMIHDKVTNK